jgi:large subunit ribosomal protein L20
MARVKRGIVSKRKHNKLGKLTKGYRGTKHRLIRAAKEASLHAGAYAFHGRKLKKRDFRTLWITRIAEATKKENMSYSVFIGKLKKNAIEIDRKILADLLLNDPQTFNKILTSIK